MTEKKIQWTRKTPLSRQEAAGLVHLADRYESGVFLQGGDTLVNVKSTLGLLSLMADAPLEVTLMASGTDEAEAAEAVMELCGRLLRQEAGQ